MGETVKKFRVTNRMGTIYSGTGRILSASKKGNLWSGSKDIEKLTDNRCRIKMEENSNE